jgi:hypothetical protein
MLQIEGHLPQPCTERGNRYEAGTRIASKIQARCLVDVTHAGPRLFELVRHRGILRPKFRSPLPSRPDRSHVNGPCNPSFSAMCA